jgi:hypothetical protein
MKLKLLLVFLFLLGLLLGSMTGLLNDPEPRIILNDCEERYQEGFRNGIEYERSYGVETEEVRLIY